MTNANNVLEGREVCAVGRETMGKTQDHKSKNFLHRGSGRGHSTGLNRYRGEVQHRRKGWEPRSEKKKGLTKKKG